LGSAYDCQIMPREELCDEITKLHTKIVFWHHEAAQLKWDMVHLH